MEIAVKTTTSTTTTTSRISKHETSKTSHRSSQLASKEGKAVHSPRYLRGKQLVACIAAPLALTHFPFIESIADGTARGAQTLPRIHRLLFGWKNYNEKYENT